MRKIFALFILSLLFVQCKKEDAKEQALDIKKSVNLSIERFDVKYAQATPATLPKLKAEYPFLFPSQFPDTLWTNKLKDKYFIELNKEVAMLLTAIPICSIFFIFLYFKDTKVLLI